MKKNALFACIIGATCLSACTPDLTEDKAHYFIYGSFLSWKYYAFDDLKLNRDLGTVDVNARPMEIDDMNFEPEKYDRTLYWSLSNRKLSKSASEEESFAFERILERERTLESDFNDYVQRLGRANDKTASAGFVSAYIRGVPSIVADKELFGLPAGSDLSEWFLFRDYNIIGISGVNLEMTERAGMVEEYLTSSEYFTEDKMMPLALNIRIKEIPDEISCDNLHARQNGDDSVIKVTIKIPVTIEAYWAWCKAQYNNPNAEECFYDGNIVTTIAFNSKK